MHDDEAMLEHAEYVAKLASEVPTFAPDERQQGFFAFVEQSRNDPDLEDVRFIRMNGFLASNVNLGWLKDRAMRIVEEKFGTLGKYGCCRIIDMLAGETVQRLKCALVRPDAERWTIEVFLVTQDDEGQYEYRFAVPLPEEPEEDDDVDDERRP